MKKGFRWKKGRRVGRRCEIFHFGEPRVKKKRKKLLFLRSRRGEERQKRIGGGAMMMYYVGKHYLKKKKKIIVMWIALLSKWFQQVFFRRLVLQEPSVLWVGWAAVRGQGSFSLKVVRLQFPLPPWPSKRQTVKRSEGAY